MRYRTLHGLLLGASLALLPLAAHADYLSSARDALKKGDLRSAQIDLRNAVRSDPQNAEAHYWLGRVSFELGDPVAAEREATAARDRGFDAQLATRLLGQALLAQSKFDVVLDQMKPGGKDANLDAIILVFRGYAMVGQKKFDEAQKSFAAAEQQAPNQVEPLLAESRLALSRGDMDGAQAKIDKAISVQPKSSEALRAKAQILRIRGDMTGAMSVLDELLHEQPSIVQGRLDRASLEIALNKPEAAKADIEQVLKATPGNVQATYLQAVMAVQAKDFRAANADLEKIAAYIPRIPRGYYLLAVVKQEMGQLEQADDAARRYLGRAPNDLAAYKIMARVQFAKRRPDQVVETLSRVADTGKGDAETYDLLGRAYAATGRAEDAVKAFQKAQSLAPQDIGVQTRLAGVRMGMGQPDVAMGDLEHTLELAPKIPQVGEALFFAALATGDLNKARASLDKIKAAEGGDTDVVANLEGLLKLANLDLDGARGAFEALSQKSPDFIPAKINLARVMAMQGKGRDAEKLLAGILDKQPAAEPALTMLTSDYVQTNRISQAIPLVERAHTALPDNVRVTVTLGNLYIRAGDPQKAFDLVDQSKGATANSTEMLALKANALLTLGQKEKARDTLVAMLKQDPGQLSARQRLVSLLMETGDFENARNVVKAGIAASPRNYDMLQAYVMIDLKATGVDAALASADNLLAQDRDFTTARALKGDVYLAANRPDDAIKAYSDAAAVAPSTMLTTRVVAAQLRAGRQNEARKTLQNWLTTHPADTVAAEQLAELDISANRLEDAATSLRLILEKKPHDPVALNNLAWVYQQLHDDRAMDLARQAYVLQPGAQTADTLGWILTKSGKAETGLALLRQASAEASNDPRVQYHFAVALKDTGNKADAIKLLTAIVAVKANFTEKAEAQKLLDELGKGS